MASNLNPSATEAATSGVPPVATEAVPSQVLKRIPPDNKYCLGPTDESLSDPTQLLDSEQGKLLCTRDKFRLYGWFNRRIFRSWPSATPGYLNWFHRMIVAKGDAWREIGIYDAIVLSSIKIDLNLPLLAVAFYFWSDRINTFHFPFGMLSPSLLDVSALACLRPDGKEISAATCFEVPFKFTPGINNKPFIEHYSQTDGPIDEKEHTAFLLYWLSNFVFCTASLKPIQQYVPLAYLLANGHKVALGQLFLGELYKGLHNIVSRLGFGLSEYTAKNIAGPLWFLQLWFCIYFKDFMEPSNKTLTAIPTHWPLLEGETLGTRPPSSYAEHVLVSKYSASGGKADWFCYYFRYLYEYGERPANTFSPYFQKTFPNPSWLNVLINQVGDDPENIQEFRRLWALYVSPRFLLTGLSFGSKHIIPSFEYYYPACFASIFGHAQGVPVFILHNIKPDRHNFQAMEDIEEIHIINNSLLAKEVPDFEFCSRLTINYRKWWQAYQAEIFKRNFDDVQALFVYAEETAVDLASSSAQDKNPSKVDTLPVEFEGEDDIIDSPALELVVVKRKGPLLPASIQTKKQRKPRAKKDGSEAKLAKGWTLSNIASSKLKSFQSPSDDPPAPSKSTASSPVSSNASRSDDDNDHFDAGHEVGSPTNLNVSKPTTIVDPNVHIIGQEVDRRLPIMISDDEDTHHEITRGLNDKYFEAVDYLSRDLFEEGTIAKAPEVKGNLEAILQLPSIDVIELSPTPATVTEEVDSQESLRKELQARLQAASDLMGVKIRDVMLKGDLYATILEKLSAITEEPYFSLLPKSKADQVRVILNVLANRTQYINDCNSRQDFVAKQKQMTFLQGEVIAAATKAKAAVDKVVTLNQCHERLEVEEKKLVEQLQSIRAKKQQIQKDIFDTKATATTATADVAPKKKKVVEYQQELSKGKGSYVEARLRLLATKTAWVKLGEVIKEDVLS